MDKPDHLFNVDKSGISMDLRQVKAIVSKGEKNSDSTSKGDRDHMMVNCCVIASGQAVPPWVIFSKFFPSGHYSKRGPEPCLYAKSSKGSIDEDRFYCWFSEWFVPKTQHLDKSTFY